MGTASYLTTEEVKSTANTILELANVGEFLTCEQMTFNLALAIVEAISMGRCQDPEACCKYLLVLMSPNTGGGVVS